MGKFLKKIMNDVLSEDEAYNLMLSILGRDLSDVEIASILTLYEVKGVDISELVGFREGIMESSHKLDFSEFKTLDICGTGGDGKNTFNISTISALVLAAGGVKVAKHGNYGSTSICGSSNVLEYLGYNFLFEEDLLKRQLDKCGITFLHAPLFHPKLLNVSSIRKEMGIPTIFNLLGPLCNPSKPNISFVGLSHPMSDKICFDYWKILERNCDKFAVVVDMNSYDEISLTGMFKLLLRVGYLGLEPEEFNFERLNEKDIAGGSIKENAEIMLQILSGKGTEAQNNVVSMNAGIGFMLYYDMTLDSGVEMAREVIKSGEGFRLLKKLVQ